MKTMSKQQSVKSSRITDLLFATAIEKCGTPLLQRKSLKVRKNNAVRKVTNYILQMSGQLVNERQILKKLNNMKNRIKIKLNNKDQRNLAMNHGEQRLHQLICAVQMQADVRVKTDIDNGKPLIEELNNLHNVDLTAPCDNIEEQCDVQLKCEVDLDVPPVGDFSNFNEEQLPSANELATDELQRLVLIKQLEALEEQKSFYINANETMAKFDKLVELQMHVYTQKLQKN